MPKIFVVKGFSHADDGIHAVRYEAGKEPVEVSDSCAEAAIRSGWGLPFAAPAPSERTQSGSEGGPDQKSASLPQVPASPRKTSRRSKSGRKKARKAEKSSS